MTDYPKTVIHKVRCPEIPVFGEKIKQMYLYFKTYEKFH